MAPPANENARPGPTPVPPRGAKRKPSRPTSKRPAAARPVAGRAGAGASGAGGRPADSRRTALAKRRRRNQTLLAGGVIGLIIVVVAVLVVIRATSGGAKSNTASATVTASSLDRVTSTVSLEELKAAAQNYPLVANNGIYGGYPTVTSDPPITTTGKPDVLYIGAEYCPYCATERWPIVLALSKFGTFHNLQFIHSDNQATEKFREVPTFSFYHSTYTSPYLTFTPVEEATVTGKTLQVPTAAQQAIVTKYDKSGSIPFVYFNGKAIISAAEYNPGLLVGKSFQQVADNISGGTSQLGSSVAADAGAIVSVICRMTGGKPANVCSLFPKPITK